MKTLVNVLENYFGTNVEETRSVEAKINGKWYQVVPVDEADNNEELSFVTENPVHEFEGKEYYIVEQ